MPQHRSKGGHSPRQSGKRQNNKTIEGNDGDGVGRGGKQRKKPDGLRYPKREQRRTFDCPFHKYDPLQYHDCRGYILRHVSDVVAHIERRHTLERNAVYCPNCRFEFHEKNAEASRDRHVREKQCTTATPKDTGVLLPKEYEDVKSLLGKEPRNIQKDDKWNRLWMELFKIPLPQPSSPYVEIPNSTARDSFQLQIPGVYGTSILHDIQPRLSSQSTQGTKSLPMDAPPDGPPHHPPFDYNAMPGIPSSGMPDSYQASGKIAHWALDTQHDYNNSHTSHNMTVPPQWSIDHQASQHIGPGFDLSSLGTDFGGFNDNTPGQNPSGQDIDKLCWPLTGRH
ncbi:hypothetical protein FZEAL_6184 [Fusarium zealandicum]|uniref:C2H2-type domain-containing protein n=1 Tax=Fusarium zealandicum TaxID=1053134 RepID=A0A8H4XK56_9HYPO|nr:hypothetical protein FZEAL_6184 [Fusarium zealandicum]